VNFSTTPTTELKSAVETLEKERIRGLIIDLRNNPGGLLRAAVEISDLFLTDGVIVSTKGRNHREEVFRAKLDGTMLMPMGRPVPIVVLVNHYSASASEILAAALQDHKRAVVMGERSYGKGSVQNILLLENDSSALKLTTAGYFRPSGKNIHRFPDAKDFEAARIDPDEWGVKPDAGMETAMTELERVEYMAYRSDRDIIRKSPKAPEKDAQGNPKKPYEDKVLKKALDYLRKEVAGQPPVLKVGDA
ncbi:MAG: S41 family peptidase, partial [Gemmataceae bacterium]